MNPYVAMLRRDIYKDPWLTLVLVVLLFVKLLGVEINLDWHLVFILYVSLYPMRIQANQGSTYRMLLPKENKIECNYALGMVVLLVFLFSVFGSSSLIDSFVTLSVFLLFVSGATLLNLYLNNKLIELIMQMLLGLSLVASLGFIDSAVSGLAFRFELSTDYLVLCCFLALVFTAGITKRIYGSLNNKGEFSHSRRNLELTVFDFNIAQKIARNSKSTGEKSSFFDTIKSKFLKVLNGIFNILVFDKGLNSSLHPSGSVNVANGGIMGFFIGIFIYRLLGSDGDFVSNGIESLMWLLFLACNILFCFDFVSNKKLMAGLWLQFQSQNRATYMQRLVWLLASRHASSLLPCLIILALSVKVVTGELNLNQELISLIVGGYTSWLIQLGLMLYITPKIEFSKLHIIGVFIAQICIFTMIMFLVTKLTFWGEILLFVFASLYLGWNVFKWRNTQLELI